jgi:hypothetical protein
MRNGCSDVRLWALHSPTVVPNGRKYEDKLMLAKIGILSKPNLSEKACIVAKLLSKEIPSVRIVNPHGGVIVARSL